MAGQYFLLNVSSSIIHGNRFINISLIPFKKAFQLFNLVAKNSHVVISTTWIKGECSVLKFFFVMDENDALSEYNKIPLGHNRTNGTVYPKIYFKVEICSAH